MNCISINYKISDETVRSSFAFSADIRKMLMEELSEKYCVSESVVLCTCSRTEIYFTGEDEHVTEILSKYSRVPDDDIKRFSMFYHGKNAVVHLFRVACGIESMVIGEDEILRQTREAYKLSRDNGKAGHEFNIIFQAAFACAKKIKTKTFLSGVSVSTATLTANEAAGFCSYPKVLVIGATGAIGRIVVKNLISHKNVSVTVTLRQHSADTVSGFSPEISVTDYSKRYDAADEYDCIISATSSPHYTITRSEFNKNIRTRKPRLLIDLAVPNDIDRKLAEDKDIRLIGIDFFEELARENNEKKAESVETAKCFIKSETDTLFKNIYFKNFLGSNSIDENEKKLLCKMKSALTAEQFSAVLDAMGGK